MLSPYALPRADGVPQGRYRLLFGQRNEAFFGVTYVDGRSAAPVDGRTIVRQHAAFGDAVKVEPWDLETAERCLEHLHATGREDLVPALEAWIAERTPAPTEGEGEKSEAAPVADGLDDLTVEELRAKAVELNLGLAKNIGKPKALVALRAHAAKVAAEAKPAPAPTEGEGEKSEAEEGGEGDAEKGDAPTE